MGVRDRRVRVGAVVAERGLVVGAGGHQPGHPGPPPGPGLEELGDRGVALVFQRLGRHRQPRVLGEQGHEAVGVGGLERVREPAGELALPGRPRRGRGVAACGGKLGGERGTGPLQGAVHRHLADCEHVGGLRRRVAEHVAQHQDGALPGRQALQAGHERQRHALPWSHSVLRDRARCRAGHRAARPGKAAATAARSGGWALAGAQTTGTWPRSPGGGRCRAARSGTGWSRSCTARYASRHVPRTGRARARRPAASPAACPRRPGPSRGSGSSAAAARAGRGR